MCAIMIKEEKTSLVEKTNNNRVLPPIFPFQDISFERILRLYCDQTKGQAIKLFKISKLTKEESKVSQYVD